MARAVTPTEPFAASIDAPAPLRLRAAVPFAAAPFTDSVPLGAALPFRRATVAAPPASDDGAFLEREPRACDFMRLSLFLIPAHHPRAGPAQFMSKALLQVKKILLQL